jgi:hypothetical protein
MTTQSRRLSLAIVLAIGLVAVIALLRKPLPLVAATPLAQHSASPTAQPATTDPARLTRTADAGPNSDIVPDEMDAPAFACSLWMQQFRRVYPSMPPDVLHMLACGEVEAGVDALIALAQAGDQAAQGALLTIAASECEQSPSRSPENTERYFAATMRIAREQGASPRTLERMGQIMALELRRLAPEYAVHCRRAEREIHALLPSFMQQLSDILGRSWTGLLREDEQEVGIELARKTAVPGRPTDELALAHALLEKQTDAATEEAIAILQRLSGTQPEAKVELAQCRLRNCDGRGDDALGVQLLTEAALDGNFRALSSLSYEPKIAESTESSPAAGERFAWRQLRNRLAELGCLGTQEYMNWATRPANDNTLLLMSPSEDAVARARTRELMTELPRVRRAFGC